jgi:hypothetical protein
MVEKTEAQGALREVALRKVGVAEIAGHKVFVL